MAGRSSESIIAPNVRRDSLFACNFLFSTVGGHSLQHTHAPYSLTHLACANCRPVVVLRMVEVQDQIEADKPNWALKPQASGRFAFRIRSAWVLGVEWEGVLEQHRQARQQQEKDK